MKMRAQRLPEVPGKPLRHPWGALGALQGAVGAVLVPPGELQGSSWERRGGPQGALGRSLGSPGDSFCSLLEVFSRLLVEAPFEAPFKVALVTIFAQFSEFFGTCLLEFFVPSRAGAAHAIPLNLMTVTTNFDVFPKFSTSKLKGKRRRKPLNFWILLRRCRGHAFGSFWRPFWLRC